MLAKNTKLDQWTVPSGLLYDKTKDKDRKDYRQREVAPKVDAYFAWVKESLPKVPAGGSTYTALQYSLNQEEYLRFFRPMGKSPWTTTLQNVPSVPSPLGVRTGSTWIPSAERKPAPSCTVW